MQESGGSPERGCVCGGNISFAPRPRRRLRVEALSIGLAVAIVVVWGSGSLAVPACQAGVAGVMEVAQACSLSSSTDLSGVTHLRVLSGGVLEIDVQGGLSFTGTLEVDQGGSVVVKSGSHLTLCGGVEAGRYQIFHAEEGAIRRDITMPFQTGSSAAVEVFPEWWGAVALPNDPGTKLNKAAFGSLTDWTRRVWHEGSGVLAVDCTEAIQAAVNFASRPAMDLGQNASYQTGVVRLGWGFYLCAGEITLHEGTRLLGSGDPGTTLVHVPMEERTAWQSPHRAFITAEPHRDEVDLFTGSLEEVYVRVELAELRILGDYSADLVKRPERVTAPPTSSVGLHLNRTQHTAVRNVTICGFRDAALRVSYGAVCSFDGLECGQAGASIRIEGLNPDVSDWSYWLPPCGYGADPGYCPPDFPSIGSDLVAMRRHGNGQFYFMNVGPDGTVMDRFFDAAVDVTNHFQLSRMVADGATAATSGSRLFGYGDAGYFPRTLQSPCPAVPLGGGEGVVDVKGTSTGQGEAHFFCLLTSGEIVQVKTTRKGVVTESSSSQPWGLLPFSVAANIHSGFAVAASSNVHLKTDIIDSSGTPIWGLHGTPRWDLNTTHFATFSSSGSELLHAYRPGVDSKGAGPHHWYLYDVSLPSGTPPPDLFEEPGLVSAHLELPASNASLNAWSEILFLLFRGTDGAIHALRGELKPSSSGPTQYVWSLEKTWPIVIRHEPVCISSGSGRADAFVVDMQGHIRHGFWTLESGWSDTWLDLSTYDSQRDPSDASHGHLATPRVTAADRPGVVTVCSTSPSRLDLLVVASGDGEIFRRRFDKRWYDWESLRDSPTDIGLNPLDMELVASSASGSVVLGLRAEHLSLPMIASWVNGPTTAQSFRGGAAEYGVSVGVDVDSAHVVSFESFTVQASEGRAVEVDGSSLVSFSSCWFESNVLDVLAAGLDSPVEGLSFRSCRVVGGMTIPPWRAVVALDRVLWADIEVALVENPFDCLLATSPNSLGVFYRGPIGSATQVPDLPPASWCYTRGVRAPRCTCAVAFANGSPCSQALNCLGLCP